MFVNMWMTRDVVTVSTEASLADVAALMTRHRIRRLPVLQGASRKLLGIISYSDVLHAFPRDLNPFSADAAEQLVKSGQGARVRAVELMTRQPAAIASDAPVESTARMMRAHHLQPARLGGCVAAPGRHCGTPRHARHQLFHHATP